MVNTPTPAVPPAAMLMAVTLKSLASAWLFSAAITSTIVASLTIWLAVTATVTGSPPSINDVTGTVLSVTASV